MDRPNMSFPADLRRIQPKPGEVFFLNFPSSIDFETADHIRRMWKQAMGDIPVMVLSDGVEVGCMAHPEKVG